jgi:hypothetical protein
MTISKKGQRIRTLDDWGEHAGPKRKEHWVADRSAMECARSWLGVESPAMPDRVVATLATDGAFGTVETWEAEPEARLSFDTFAGEPRNADLVVFARDEHGEFLLAIEAKADETFGQTVADALADAVERKLENPRSNGVARIEQLAAALFGPRPKGSPALNELRYQLLTAAAGALKAGKDRGVTRVVMLVQEFVTRLTVEEKQAANALDLDGFVARLSKGAVQHVEPNRLHGPFRVPGAPLVDTPPDLYVGKAVCNLIQGAPAALASGTV